ncbi:MAG: hypothetical protein ACRDFS_04950 [Chloroflexota bacterium]
MDDVTVRVAEDVVLPVVADAPLMVDDAVAVAPLTVELVAEVALLVVDDAALPTAVVTGASGGEAAKARCEPNSTTRMTLARIAAARPISRPMVCAVFMVVEGRPVPTSTLPI